MKKINEDQLEQIAKGFLEYATQKGWFEPNVIRELLGGQGSAPHHVGSREPIWCEQGKLRLAQAAHDQTKEKIDFSRWSLGKFELVLDLKRSEEGAGYLELDWKATEPNPKSWWIAFFLNEDPDEPPALDYELGDRLEGHELFTSQRLGFDPYEIPFRYMVYVREAENSNASILDVPNIAHQDTDK